MFTKSSEIPLTSFNNIPYLRLSSLSGELNFQSNNYNDNKKVIIHYKQNKIILSHNSSFIMINDEIHHLFHYIIFKNNDFYIPAKSFIKILNTTNIITNISIDSSEKALIISSPDYNITDYQIITKGNGYTKLNY